MDPKKIIILGGEGEVGCQRAFLSFFFYFFLIGLLCVEGVVQLI